jgi:hypothetical protein
VHFRGWIPIDAGPAQRSFFRHRNGLAKFHGPNCRRERSGAGAENDKIESESFHGSEFQHLRCLFCIGRPGRAGSACRRIGSARRDHRPDRRGNEQTDTGVRDQIRLERELARYDQRG